MANGSTENVAVTSIGTAGGGLILVALFIQTWVGAVILAGGIYLISRRWGQLVLLTTTVLGFLCMHTFEYTSEGLFVVIKTDHDFHLLALLCIGYFVVYICLLLPFSFLLTLSENPVVALIVYLPILLLSIPAVFYCFGIDVVPFVDLPAKIDYAKLFTIKGLK